jgi:hypothetical protein
MSQVRLHIGKTDDRWVVAFIATHLIGGVTVALNAWLYVIAIRSRCQERLMHSPLDGLLHCLRITKPDIVLLDSDRAYMLGPQHAALGNEGVGPVALSAVLSTDG